MIILDVVKELKERFGYEEIPTVDLINVLRDGFQVIKDLAVREGEGYALQVSKFGTFRVLKREARVGFNPKTREKIQIPQQLTFKLRTSYQLKTALNEAFQANKSKPKAKSTKKTSKK
jgi:nucleoid DNA-binding protein